MELPGFYHGSTVGCKGSSKWAHPRLIFCAGYIRTGLIGDIKSIKGFMWLHPTENEILFSWGFSDEQQKDLLDRAPGYRWNDMDFWDRNWTPDDSGARLIAATRHVLCFESAFKYRKEEKMSKGEKRKKNRELARFNQRQKDGTLYDLQTVQLYADLHDSDDPSIVDRAFKAGWHPRDDGFKLPFLLQKWNHKESLIATVQRMLGSRYKGGGDDKDLAYYVGYSGRVDFLALYAQKGTLDGEVGRGLVFGAFAAKALNSFQQALKYVDHSITEEKDWEGKPRYRDLWYEIVCVDTSYMKDCKPVSKEKAEQRFSFVEALTEAHVPIKGKSFRELIRFSKANLVRGVLPLLDPKAKEKLNEGEYLRVALYQKDPELGMLVFKFMPETYILDQWDARTAADNGQIQVLRECHQRGKFSGIQYIWKKLTGLIPSDSKDKPFWLDPDVQTRIAASPNEAVFRWGLEQGFKFERFDDPGYSVFEQVITTGSLYAIQYFYNNGKLKSKLKHVAEAIVKNDRIDIVEWLGPRVKEVPRILDQCLHYDRDSDMTKIVVALMRETMSDDEIQFQIYDGYRLSDAVKGGRMDGNLIWLHEQGFDIYYGYSDFFWFDDFKRWYQANILTGANKEAHQERKKRVYAKYKEERAESHPRQETKISVRDAVKQINDNDPIAIRKRENERRAFKNRVDTDERTCSIVKIVQKMLKGWSYRGDNHYRKLRKIKATNAEIELAKEYVLTEKAAKRAKSRKKSIIGGTIGRMLALEEKRFINISPIYSTNYETGSY